jgi:glycosyltransferase involved in cell wall biosynthesis
MTPRVEFWSSTEYTTFLPALVRALEARGVKTRQRYQVTQADYWAARGKMARLWLRARCYALYPIRVGFRFLSRKGGPRVGIVCTNTFFAPWVAMSFAGRRGSPVVNWVFDLYPDVLTVAGKLRRGSFAERYIAGWVRSAFHHSAANVFLGERLLEHAQERFGPIPRAYVFAVGADGAPFRHDPPTPRATGARATILYCGNLGRMHDVGTLAGAIRRGLPDGVRMEFRGNGAGFRELESAVAGATGAAVSLGGNLQGEAWHSAMRAAEVALVTLKCGAEGLVMPSKTYSAMVAGQALLAVCPARSDLADTVRKHDAGWVVEPGDTAGLLAALSQIAAQPDEVLRLRVNSFNAGHGAYDQDAIGGGWAALFDTIAAARASHR